MNPWDTKLTHQLTEHEMAAYANHLVQTNVLDEQQEIEKGVEYIVNAWRKDREKPHMFGVVPVRYRISRGRRAGSFYDEAAVPPIHEYSDINVLLPLWLDPAVVEYLAREQIMEQWDWQ